MNFQEYVDKNYSVGIDGNFSQLLREFRYLIENQIPIYVMGNGGSAYTANHFVQDLIKVLSAKAVSLSEGIGLIMAVSNDIDYEDIFKFQLQRLNPSGVLIAISCSGNSKNIIKALRWANENDMASISFTANDGGEAAELSTLNFNVDTENIYVAESIHGMIFHYLIDTLGGEYELDVPE